MASKASNDSDRRRLSIKPPDSTDQTVEDVTIIWFDQYMDSKDNADDVETTKRLLRKINDYVLLYSKVESCLDYIRSVPKEKIFLITTGSYAREHLEKIHHLQQVDSIFIFCFNRERYLYLKEKHAKIIDLFVEQDELIASLTSNIELVTKQATAFGLFDGKERSTRYLTRESASFLWFQLLTDVLKNIALENPQNLGMEEMLSHCQSYYRGNQPELTNIESFRQTYKAEDAIVWYSKQSFVYRLVNKALRTEDIDALYTFRVYITHLRTRIAHEHQKLRRAHAQGKSNVIHLYRGLKLSREEINQMVENLGALISMNGFFSTSRDVEQATRFATKKSTRKDVIGVLLEISGDIHLDQMVFADIAQFSTFPKEQEVLFDLASVFKITHVEFDKGKNLWTIQLTGVEKSSYIVNEYLKSIAKESEESNSTLLLSRLMCDMGEYGKSEKYLKRLLRNLPGKHKDISRIFFHLGRVAYFRGEFKPAAEHYSKALQLQKEEIHPQENSFDVARTLHNLANIYSDQKQLHKALEFYEKSLAMKRLILAEQSDHPSIATTLAAIGSIYLREGETERALDLYRQSYQMKKATLVHDHPSLADTLNGLGVTYQQMDDSQQALDCFRQALQIKRKTLPATHPSISATLNNMGIVYRKEGDYNKALICYTQALNIEQISLSMDNLELADTYHNLCTLYRDRAEHVKALEMAKCKLQILKKNYDGNDESIKDTQETIEEIKQTIAAETGQEQFLEVSL